MKFTTSQSALHQPLSLLSRYVSARPALPVLANILIEVTETSVTLSATNLDVTIKADIPANIITSGSTTLPARLLNEVVSTLPSGDITISLVGDQCTIQSTNTHSSLNTITPQDFPTLPQFNKDKAIALPLDSLKEVSEKVLFAAATDEARPVLTNLLLKPSDGKLILVATDGFRLSEVIQEVKNNQISPDMQLLLPARLISEMLRLSDNQSSELLIDVVSQSNQIGMKVGNIACFSKRIEAAYPPYERIIPTEFTTTITVEQSDLIQALKVANVFAKETGALIKLHIQPLNGELVISAQSTTLGQNQSTVPVQGTGDDQMVAFNVRYVLEGLSAFGAGQISIAIKNEDSPMMLTSAKQSNFRHIIMPIKVDN